MPAPDIKTDVKPHEGVPCLPPLPTNEDVRLEEASFPDYKTKSRQPCTAEKCITAIQAYQEFCREAGCKPWSGGYREWERTQPDAPGWGSIIKYLGSWNKACRIATGEFATVTLNPVGGVRCWSQEKCVNVLRAFEKHCQQTGEKGTVDSYERWRRSRNAPSARTLCNVFDTWNNARRVAAKDADEIVSNSSVALPLKPHEADK